MAGKSNSFFLLSLASVSLSGVDTRVQAAREAKKSVLAPEKLLLESMYVCYLEISLHFRDADMAKFTNKKFAFAAHLFWCVSVMCSRILLYQIFASRFLSGRECAFRRIAKRSDEFFSCSLECIAVSECVIVTLHALLFKCVGGF